MRSAGAGADPWRIAAEAGEGAPSGPGLYEILGADEPLPPQEEQAMSEMLGGFHKLLRYMHGRVPKGAPDLPAAATPTVPAPPPASPQPPAAHPDAPDRRGS